MLINALCEYYDMLAESGKVLPDGYSGVNVHYLIALTPEGKIDTIINYQEAVEQEAGGKKKERFVPKRIILPKRTEKSGIEANIIDHRPLYIFGLNYANGVFSPEDRTEKARKSHADFVSRNLAFLEGIDTPAVNAFRNFLLNWKAEQETQNPNLLALGKAYGKSSYGFCLSGSPDKLLNNEPEVKKRWESFWKTKCEAGEGDSEYAQCAVSGKKEPIARIHNKIKGVYGGLATGSVLISFKNPSESSYGNEQAYNSNISERAMRNYTEALNYLLSSEKHKILISDMTIVFWAMDQTEECEDMVKAIFGGISEKETAAETEQRLRKLLEDGKEGTLLKERLGNGTEKEEVQSDTDFYILGLKANSSRISVKFIYRKRYAELLWNLAKFQNELQMSKTTELVPFWKIEKELQTPKSKNDKANPALIAKLFDSVVYGRAYPEELLATVIRRIKTDTDQQISAIRAGVIRACLNRNRKEEIGVNLNKKNLEPEYLCGRLFAVLENLQQEAAGVPLNRTIKDAYFSSAASKPDLVFPKLLTLAQHHLKNKNVEEPKYFEEIIEEIMDGFNGNFPGTVSYRRQGDFMIGYYQQKRVLDYRSKSKAKGKEREEK